MSVTESSGEQTYNFPELLSKLNQTARERDFARTYADAIAKKHAQLRIHIQGVIDLLGPDCGIEWAAIRDLLQQGLGVAAEEYQPWQPTTTMTRDPS